ncbi:MAG: 2-dehydro-3-deoxygalactonokinase [Oceanospirillaceae bacterium]|nr:2-dehydro-3-deoxygalactonokinase [Oceanospirillaceae bacterium]
MQWKNTQGVSWVAVDWGTSHLRIWLMSQDNQVLDHNSSGQGMASLNGAAEFEQVLFDCLQSLLVDDDTLPVVCCGMVGAKQGWQDAGYAAVPHNPLQYQTPVALPTKHRQLWVWVLPGLCQQQPADVMRGEETQIAGVLCEHKDFTGVLCLPGTHSKWALCCEGEVVSFNTFMTGELFALLAKQSVLRYSVMDEQWCDEVFHQGVSDGFNNPSQFTGALFSVRAKDILGSGAAQFGKARLSGLLIGMELAGTKPWWQGQKVMLLGDSLLQSLYKLAMDQLNIDVVLMDATQMTLAGLTAAYERQG